MNYLFIITFLATSIAHAETLEAHLEKLKAVIEKDGRCDFAVAQVPDGKYKDNRAFWPTTVACSGDIEVNAGTMKARSGCGAFHLDADDLSTKGVGMEGRMKIANGKKCAEGGFEEVMGLNLYGYVDEAAGVDASGKPNMSVGWVFYDGSRSNFMHPKVVYVKSGGEKYQAWWTKEHDKSVAKEATKAIEIRRQESAAQQVQKVNQQKAKAKETAEQKKKDDLWN